MGAFSFGRAWTFCSVTGGAAVFRTGDPETMVQIKIIEYQDKNWQVYGLVYDPPKAMSGHNANIKEIFQRV